MKTLKSLFHIMLSVAIFAFFVACDETTPEPTPNPDDPNKTEEPIIYEEEEPELPELTETLLMPEINIENNKMIINEADKALSESTAKFALNMFSEIISNTGFTENQLFSPLSASLATSLVANGTAANSYLQIAEALGFSGMDIKQINEYNYKLINGLPILHDEMNVTFANALFATPDMKIFPNFLQRLDKYYDAEIFQNDFNPIDVNNWVSSKTNGLITKIVEEEESFDFAMVNALNFEGIWSTPFNVNSKPSDFVNADKSVTSLHALSKQLSGYHKEFPNFSFISIPYKSNNFRLNILHPSEDSNFMEIISDLLRMGWGNTKSQLNENTIQLAFPPFEIENNISIKNYLINIGIKDIYDEQYADFKEMTYFSPTYISDTKQSNFLKVDETGTIASSSTIHEGEAGADVSDYPTYIINSPFIFMVTEESSGAILFMGCINKL